MYLLLNFVTPWAFLQRDDAIKRSIPKKLQVNPAVFFTFFRA